MRAGRVGWEGRLLLVVTAVLVAIGLASVYSASSTVVARGGRVLGSSLVVGQAIGVAVGALALLVAGRVDHALVRRAAWPLVAFAAAALIVPVLPFTTSIAPRINGSRRWIEAGWLSFQPSEVAKLAVVVWTAAICAKKGPELRRLRRGPLPVLAVVGPICALILLQPDLSGAVLVGMLAMIVLFAAGARIGHFILVALVALPVLWRQIEAAQYRVLRVTAFLDPGLDRLNVGYQVDQSLIAVGSGQLFGVGYGAGRQKLGFLPYAYSDFIFSTIAEEWGFVGVVTLIVLFGAFVALALRLAQRASDPFARYLALGLAALIGVSVLLHTGVGLGFLPATGLTLPFLSYGRSNVVVALVATGLLVNLGRTVRP